MKRLKFHLVLMELLFLAVVLGGGTISYSIFGTEYYSRHKISVIKNAYEDIKEENLEGLDEAAYDMLQSYEQDNLWIYIIDEDYKGVYTTRKDLSEKAIHDIVANNIDRFSKEPEVFSRESRNSNIIRLLGLVYQNNKKYYVCIRENIIHTESIFSYSERFLLCVFLIASLIGSAVMYWQSRKIARPIEQMARVSRQMANRDFSVRAEENAKYEEAITLARNFNNMADQISGYINQLEIANDYLSDQNLQKKRMEQSQKEFMANISHDLKTPLAVISSQVEMLELLGEKADKSYYFESIREEIQKMSELITNLLQLSTMEHKLANMEMSRLNMTEVLEYLALKYDALFRQKKIRMQVDLEQACYVWGNREYIEQAVNNYLMNAFEHTQAGRIIAVSLHKEGNQIVIRVFNEGETIDESMKDNIWKSYYQKANISTAQEERSAADENNNAGLGLYIVKTIVNIHEGTFGVENRPNGVQFWISLPKD
ncbi:MAG: HAMP domain-containing sensor histidine kinase [Lachnospiraceae bacterium]|nr:HAMP domain-containing sensor histidine kinase [Lachnospiraceae bacterium]